MRISVITSVYNNAQELMLLYESLLSQKEYVYEWIVSDDGSGDDSWAIMNHIANESPFPFEGITHIKKGSRYAANLNNAARKATGDIIFSVNGDSYIAPDALKQISTTYVKGSAGSALRINQDKDGNFVCYDWRVPGGTNKIIEVTKEPEYWKLLTGNGLICERQVLEKVGFWDEGYTGYGREDWDIFLRLGKQGTPLYQYNNVHVYVEAETNGPKPDNPKNVERFEKKVETYGS